MTLKGIALLIIAICLAIFIFFVLLHQSLWFMWELIPAGDIQIAADNPSQLITPITQELSSNVTSSIQPLFPYLRRFAFSSSQDSSLLIALPKQPFLFAKQNQLASKLSSSNWQVSRFGLLIIAKSHSDSPSPKPLRQVLSHTITNSINRGRPHRPLFIASFNKGSLPFLDNSLALIGGRHTTKQQLLIYSAQHFKSISSRDFIVPTLPTEIDELQIALPSQVLASLPQPLQDQWNALLVNGFGYHHTTPLIIKHLLTYESISIRLSASNLIIAVTDDSQQFINQVIKWTQAEESYARLQPNTFRLPDGTLGHEQIPGKPRDIFQYEQQGLCQQAAWPISDSNNSNMHQLWLCAQGEQAALGTSKEAAYAAVTSPIYKNNQWLMKLGTNRLQQLSLPFIQTLSIVGNDTNATARLQLVN